MSDWLDELDKRESEATEAKWYVVGPPWGDGGFVVAGDPDPHVGRYVCNTDDLLIMDDDEAEEHGASNKLADAEFIAALRNNASELISRARRAEELERTHKPLTQGKSRYTVRVFDGDTPVWDINLSGPELDSESRVAELLESAGRQFMDTPEDV